MDERLQEDRVRSQVDPEMPELRGELLQRAECDQHMRHALGDQPSSQQWEQMKTVDADNTAWLERVVAERGWPGVRLVDSDGAHAAWLLIQHAPLEFQQRCLPLLRHAVEQGDASEVDLAYLDDRVCTRNQRLQRHGTQWRVEQDGHRLLPLEDPEHVNDHRHALGLPPIDETDINNALAQHDTTNER